MDAKTTVILDTSVLINFARIRRIDLLESHPSYDFLICDHVRDEVKEHFLEQFEAVNSALADGVLAETAADDPAELSDFVTLVGEKRLGTGECSAISLAKNRSIALAIDDRNARKRATKFAPGIQLHCTQSLVVDLIQAEVLTIAEADAIKLDWETNHCFRLKIASFGDLI
ncbi:hypothetical protein Mal15_56290 [Stieleria maiorica]|uniref:PIN domain-containing protein n=1 Tax=Stieleria maiorica TaxID=2795974 RepID=A0A5B9MJU9_9BACT|nr:hypothetical protein [Stieleria maiorica]QEG01552.1 hypothetical protein Mal15_56290 [Stieleria maiorica]